MINNTFKIYLLFLLKILFLKVLIQKLSYDRIHQKNNFQNFFTRIKESNIWKSRKSWNMNKNYLLIYKFINNFHWIGDRYIFLEFKIKFNINQIKYYQWFFMNEWMSHMFPRI